MYKTIYLVRSLRSTHTRGTCTCDKFLRVNYTFSSKHRLAEIKIWSLQLVPRSTCEEMKINQWNTNKFLQRLPLWKHSLGHVPSSVRPFWKLNIMWRATIDFGLSLRALKYTTTYFWVYSTCYSERLWMLLYMYPGKFWRFVNSLE